MGVGRYSVRIREIIQSDRIGEPFRIESCQPKQAARKHEDRSKNLPWSSHSRITYYPPRMQPRKWTYQHSGSDMEVMASNVGTQIKVNSKRFSGTFGVHFAALLYLIASPELARWQEHRT